MFILFLVSWGTKLGCLFEVSFSNIDTYHHKLPSYNCFCCIPEVLLCFHFHLSQDAIWFLFLFLLWLFFIAKLLYLKHLDTSWEAGSCYSVGFNFHISVTFHSAVISSFIPLWLKKKPDMIWIFLNLLRDVLWSNRIQVFSIWDIVVFMSENLTGFFLCCASFCWIFNLSFSFLNIWNIFITNFTVLRSLLCVLFLILFQLIDFYPHYGPYFPAYLHSW